nr:hypothetical protein [uncultured Sellimonas sp.]
MEKSGKEYAGNLCIEIQELQKFNDLESTIEKIKTITDGCTSVLSIICC